MTPAGLAAFERRDPRRAGVYAFEVEHAFDAQAERAFRARKKGWAFFQTQPPGYRRIATKWVMSAKREETRARRLAQLIADSAAGQRLGMVTKYK